MSKGTFSLDTVSDFALGSVGKAIPPSKTVDTSVKYFSTWSGSDKLLMTAQYAAKLVIPLLLKRAELQHGAGLRAKPYSPTAEGLTKFAASVSAARRVHGLWGILPIIKWLSAIERSPPRSDRLSYNLERIQALSMLAFYSLESVSFFSSPAAPVLPPTLITPSRSAWAQVWSIRAWGVYTAIQLGQLYAQLKGLRRKERMLAKSAEKLSEEEVEKTKKEKRAVVLSLVENAAFAPLIVHWSVRPVFGSELPVNILSFVAAAAAFRNGWSKL